MSIPSTSEHPTLAVRAEVVVRITVSPPSTGSPVVTSTRRRDRNRHEKALVLMRWQSLQWLVLPRVEEHADPPRRLNIAATLLGARRRNLRTLRICEVVSAKRLDAAGSFGYDKQARPVLCLCIAHGLTFQCHPLKSINCTLQRKSARETIHLLACLLKQKKHLCDNWLLENRFPLAPPCGFNSQY